MKIVIIAALALCALLSFLILFLTRQIRMICRRLDFIHTHETNMLLTSDGFFCSVNRLIDHINELLRQTEEKRILSKRESRALKESLTGISHDIRTPLTSLNGYFQLLCETDDVSERERYAAIIRARIGDLEVMLDELFTYTRLQNDSYELSPERMDFTRCAIEASLAFYVPFSEKNLRVRTEIDETPASINANEAAVRRILQNILKNALVHGTDLIELSLRQADHTVIFQCANRCEAPDAIDIDNVFNRFYKADSARGDTSTGLGLTIAYELTRRLGGTIAASLDREFFTITLGFPLC